MKADGATISSIIHPDLFVSPHILPILAEVLTCKEQQAFLQQEELSAHLTLCHRCRTAIISLLSMAEEPESGNGTADEAVHTLLLRFARIHGAIEAHEYEQLAAYAETIVAQGCKTADQSFPDVAAHLRTCSDCRLMLENTVAFIRESEETD